MSDVRVIDRGDGWRVEVLREGVWSTVVRRSDLFETMRLARRWGF